MIPNVLSWELLVSIRVPPQIIEFIFYHHTYEPWIMLKWIIFDHEELECRQKLTSILAHFSGLLLINCQKFSTANCCRFILSLQKYENIFSSVAKTMPTTDLVQLKFYKYLKYKNIVSNIRSELDISLFISMSSISLIRIEKLFILLNDSFR